MRRVGVNSRAMQPHQSTATSDGNPGTHAPTLRPFDPSTLRPFHTSTLAVTSSYLPTRPGPTGRDAIRDGQRFDDVMR